MTTEEPRPPLTLRDVSQLNVDRLNGVGEKRAATLRKNDIYTVLDLLRYYPRRYIDRTREARIADLVEGEEGMVVGRIERIESRRVRGNRSMVNITVTDGSGRLRVTFFNQPWRAKQLQEGAEVVLFGKAEVFRGGLQMTSPIVDLIGDQTGRIVPVYPQSEKTGLTSSDVARWIAEALRRIQPRTLGDPLPEAVREAHSFTDRNDAIKNIHEPETMGAASTARRRLVFDELFAIQLELVMRQREREATAVGVKHEASGGLTKQLLDNFGYELTRAQERVIDEIVDDMHRPHPMHRLLQGDVGAGKTMVALWGLLSGIEGGFQGALMAPTEVLAEQHHLGVRQLLEGLVVEDTVSLLAERPLRVELLTNSVGAADRKRILAQTIAGEVDLLIGTHSLIQETVQFFNLGMVVIDEQHRFGVEQRAVLRGKGPEGSEPDVLVMTATPIPRTAAMTVYGDLDVSVLDELPPGRTPIDTKWAAGPIEEAAMWDSVRTEVAAGRQAYVVCPLIDASDKVEVRSATETYEELTGGELHGLSVELLHGRMSGSDKEAVMRSFREGDTDVLVATTVIEVGVDVANATVMVILDAGRFGIAQLHQLRGRVGRGAHASTCWLAGEATTADGEQRIEALVGSTDGFELAEVDLELRGEGTIMGERQKGRNDLRLASLRRDRDMVGVAREAAIELLDANDPAIEALIDDSKVLLGDDDTDYLMKS
ncbi:MAG: ATP-dependent DNA helicase RecG [Acidimicrobiales bacterium]|nr:ATP-dependent DNA helicase RecG [Acidimicrobiales bacterium]RZV47329.1 MAG: ATP-dependent DNA helicase RecG [Acidimicrobiales bacterium]